MGIFNKAVIIKQAATRPARKSAEQSRASRASRHRGRRKQWKYTGLMVRREKRRIRRRIQGNVVSTIDCSTRWVELVVSEDISAAHVTGTLTGHG